MRCDPRPIEQGLKFLSLVCNALILAFNMTGKLLVPYASILLCLVFSSSGQAKDAAFQIVDTKSVGLEISNPLSGEVCKEGDEPLHVCRPGLEVNVLGQDTCDWSDTVQYPCTRMGHSFDFTGGRPEEPITCFVVRSNRTVFGPKTERVTGESTAEYTIEVPAESGTIFHHGFQTYGPVEHTTLVHESHTCWYLKRPIYIVRFIHRFEPE